MNGIVTGHGPIACHAGAGLRGGMKRVLRQVHRLGSALRYRAVTSFNGAATGFPSFAGTKQMIWCGLLRSWPAFFKSSDAPSSGQPSTKNRSIRSFTRPIPALDSAALILPFSLDMCLPLLANSFFNRNQASVQFLGFKSLALRLDDGRYDSCFVGGQL